MISLFKLFTEFTGALKSLRDLFFTELATRFNGDSSLSGASSPGHWKWSYGTISSSHHLFIPQSHLSCPPDALSASLNCPHRRPHGWARSRWIFWVPNERFFGGVTSEGIHAHAKAKLYPKENCTPHKEHVPNEHYASDELYLIYC